jgi:phage gp36-like protein
LDSRLGRLYELPLPFSESVKSLCYPIAHWWAEKQGEKREYIQQENEAAIALIDSIVSGSSALIGVDGVIVPPVGSDSSEMAGLQMVGTFVGQRRTTWKN